MATDILVATTNPAKAERLRALLGPLFSVRATPDHTPDIGESATTHLGNAIAKAVGWARMFGGLAIASDGGLVIPALGAGWESTLTKRQTGEGVTDAERARRLLGRMRDILETRREAFWTEAVAVAGDGDLVCAWEADGTVGKIGITYEPNPSGPPGFWADALWETLDGKKRWQLSEVERRELLDPWATLAAPVRDLLARMV